jgi:hypothetical protein
MNHKYQSFQLVWNRIKTWKQYESVSATTRVDFSFHFFIHIKNLSDWVPARMTKREGVSVSNKKHVLEKSRAEMRSKH